MCVAFKIKVFYFYRDTNKNTGYNETEQMNSTEFPLSVQTLATRLSTSLSYTTVSHAFIHLCSIHAYTCQCNDYNNYLLYIGECMARIEVQCQY